MANCSDNVKLLEYNNKAAIKMYEGTYMNAEYVKLNGYEADVMKNIMVGNAADVCNSYIDHI